MINGMRTQELYDLSQTMAAKLLKECFYPWEALPEIGGFLLALGETLSMEDYRHPAEDVWIAKDARVFPSAYLTGPCIICHGAEIRHCAFIRGNVLVGENAVVGNSTELKNAILFNEVQAPHYNYVGDSILGRHAHLGAGAITSNVKSDKTPVQVKYGGESIATGLRKFGAMVGDDVEVGCNSVLNPGTVIGRRTNIYPTSCVRGVIPPDSIYKNAETIIVKQK